MPVSRQYSHHIYSLEENVILAEISEQPVRRDTGITVYT